MSFFAPEHLRELLNGRWLQRPREDATVVGVGIDTRESLTQRMFIAIRGERHDGHAYLHEAAAGGAVVAVVEQDMPSHDLPAGLGVLQTSCSRSALLRLAAAYRATLVGAKVIAITGSCGKTTTRQMTESIVRPHVPGTAAVRSFNNDIGVPLTILSAAPSDRFLLLELGTNAPGEIARLAAIAQPDIAVITNIARAHLAGLGSIERVAQEKTSLLRYLQPGGIAVLNADQPVLRACARGVERVITFGETDDADLRLTQRTATSTGQEFVVNDRWRYTLPLPGRHNTLNALAAIAVARRMGLDEEAIADALAAMQPVPMRMTRQKINGITVFNDAYNANPESMCASLEAFAESTQHAPSRIVVLGDMLELGADEAAMHEELGQMVVKLDQSAPLDAVVLIGPRCAAAADVLQRAWEDDRVIHCVDTNAARPIVTRMLKPGDTVLFKASRNMALECLIQELEMMRGPQPARAAAL